MTDSLFDKLLILRSPGIGAARFNALVRKFGDVASAAASLNSDIALRDSVLREMDMANTLNIRYVSDEDVLYPTQLRQIKNHPPVITVRGNVDVLNKSVVSMVGTRHATAAGMEFIADMASAFVEHGIAVASGMAAGTDAAAHRGALRVCGNTQTIAVLAGGVDYIWPLENESLYYQILERGAVISEMPVGFVPVATNFVQRNRWVAGICEKLILGEADLKSGSMTTARFAMDIGRPIYAVPSHPSDSRAVGPNSLIASGHAYLCMGAKDFFAENLKTQNNDKKSESENPILDKLGTIPVSESVLAELVKKSVSEIKRDLVMFELQGIVKKIDGGYIRL